MTKRILFLMSDTGGGHRAAAEAIGAALHNRYGRDQVSIELVDVFRSYSAFPLNYMPEFYPWIVKNGKSSWGAGYQFTNSRKRAQVLSQTMFLSAERRMKRMVREHPADVVISVHSVLTRPAIEAFSRTFESRPPFIVVITDLVSTHYFWYDKRADLTLAPTQTAYDRGIDAGLSPDKMRVVGLPVHPRFSEELSDKASARQTLGWRADLPTLLLVGGGDGMGALYDTVQAINNRKLTCQLVVVTGRNKVLREKLESHTWNQPIHIYGFIENMPLMMAGADILVSKAGPATICEALIAGLPMILYDAIPGQETGNVAYVVDNRAGVFAPNPGEAAAAAAAWLVGGEPTLRACQRMPNASDTPTPSIPSLMRSGVMQICRASPTNAVAR